MSKLLFDIETTGLLRRGSQLHCMVVRDLEDPDLADVYDHVGSNPIDEGLERLQAAELLVGHNSISFDVPMLQELYPQVQAHRPAAGHPGAQPPVLPQLEREGFRAAAGMGCRPSCLAPIPLAAWGYRLRCHKGNYDGGWETYSPEMRDYAVQDTEVTLVLYELMMRRMADVA